MNYVTRTDLTKSLSAMKQIAGKNIYLDKYCTEEKSLLERYRVMGISRSSRLMHRHSPSKAITAIPVPFRTHHVIEEGQPPYTMHMKRWIMYTVAEKSKHFFALSIR